MNEQHDLKSNHDRDLIEHIFKEVLPSKVRARDVPGYASLFTEDAIWCPPGASDRYGPTEIAQGFAAVIASQDIDPTFMVDEVKIMEPFGLVLGRSREAIHPRDGGPSDVVHSREMWLFRKEEGEWKIARMIWNVKPT